MFLHGSINGGGGRVKQKTKNYKRETTRSKRIDDTKGKVGIRSKRVL